MCQLNFQLFQHGSEYFTSMIMLLRQLGLTVAAFFLCRWVLQKPEKTVNFGINGWSWNVNAHFVWDIGPWLTRDDVLRPWALQLWSRIVFQSAELNDSVKFCRQWMNRNVNAHWFPFWTVVHCLHVMTCWGFKISIWWAASSTFRSTGLNYYVSVPFPLFFF